MEENHIFTFIEGENVNLVPTSAENAKLIAKWMNDPKVRKFSRNAMPRSLDEIKKWFEPQDNEGVPEHIVFNIWHKKDKKLIGTAGLNHINWLNRWANAFLQIGELEYWNQNIATEATKLILKYAFEEVNLNKVSGGVAVDNIGSWKVAEKAGFTFEGILKEEFYVDGEYIDTKRYRFLREDWFRQKNKEL